MGQVSGCVTCVRCGRAVGLAARQVRIRCVGLTAQCTQRHRRGKKKSLRLENGPPCWPRANRRRRREPWLASNRTISRLERNTRPDSRTVAYTPSRFCDAGWGSSESRCDRQYATRTPCSPPGPQIASSSTSARAQRAGLSAARMHPHSRYLAAPYMSLHMYVGACGVTPHLTYSIPTKPSPFGILLASPFAPDLSVLFVVAQTVGMYWQSITNDIRHLYLALLLLDLSMPYVYATCEATCHHCYRPMR